MLLLLAAFTCGGAIPNLVWHYNSYVKMTPYDTAFSLLLSIVYPSEYLILYSYQLRLVYKLLKN